MRGQSRYGLPHPSADVSPLGDVMHATIAVHQRLADHGEQAVLVDAAGKVYLLTPGSVTAGDAVRRLPHWHAGNFTASISDDDLRDAMVCTYHGHLRRQQAEPMESFLPVHAGRCRR